MNKPRKGKIMVSLAEINRLEQEKLESEGKLIHRPHANNARYLYTEQGDGKVHIKLWSGKRSNPDYNYIFSNKHQADTWLEDILDRYTATTKRSQERKEAKQKAQKDFKNPWNVGDIFYNSWGYDQTNIDWYKVIKVNKKSLVLKRIGAKSVPGSEGFMSESVIPDPDKESNEIIKKIIQVYEDGTPYLSAKHGYLGPWDGKPKYSSWYA